MNTEHMTEFFRRAINILFVANPRGTSIGILLGVIIDGALALFSPLLSAIEWISVSSIKLWHLIALGVITMNLPTYLKRQPIDPSIANAIAFIESAKKKRNITDWQARQMYTNLHQKVLESVTLEAGKSKTEETILSLASNNDGPDKTNK